MKVGVRIACWLGGVVLAAVAALAIVAGLFFHKFYPSPPTAHYPPPADITASQQQDFDYLAHYFELNPTYSAEAEAEARRLLAGYRARAGALTGPEFDLAVSRVVALADNGHSRVDPGPLSRSRSRMPYRLYRFDDGYHIIRARAAYQALLGARLVAIDGHAAADVVEGMFPYFGGPRNHYDQFGSVFFLESPELLHAAGLATAADRLTLRLVMADGSEREVDIAADPPDPEAPHAYSDEYLSPEPLDKEGTDWQPVLARDARLPVSLRSYRVPFQSEYWRESGVYYAQFRSNADEPGYPIKKFVTQIEDGIRRSKPRFVIVDLRFDQGGNFTTTASLMSGLTGLSPSIEHVYVISSPWTFSAGIVSLALLKEHGGSLITVVGALAGDRTRLWAEGGGMVLPNSKLSIRFATGLHDYTHSCRGQPGCFWPMYFYPMHVTTLEPEVKVGYTYDDYVNLRDPSVDKVLALVNSGSSEGGIVGH
jgi:hypothetical protein